MHRHTSKWNIYHSGMEEQILLCATTWINLKGINYASELSQTEKSTV